MIRLRTSTLEAFRRVVETEYADEAELIESLKRGQWTEGTPSWQMQAGTAWHHVLQHPLGTQQFDCYDGTPDITHEGPFGYRFGGADVAASLRHVGPGLCEVTGGRYFQAGGQRVLVEGTADHVHGLDLQDHKTKFSAPDARDYEPSLQWRFYLLIHQGAWLRYNLFDFSQPKEGFCELRDIVSFSMWPYVGMEADCREWIGRFLDWASDRGLLPYLEPKKEAGA